MPRATTRFSPISRYQRLVQRRGRFTWLLTILMLAVYFGYVLLIAFDKAVLARPIGSGFTSIGIPIGIGVILFAILLTGLYVRRANRNSIRWFARSRTRARHEAAPGGLRACPDPARHAGPCGRRGAGEPINWPAIAMFAAFIALTLAITRWAARRTRTASDFYTAGGGITGFQNGLAIAGDYMSAASFLGISAQIFADGYDGLIYSIGFLVGWPIILFLMAERLRNLGRYTFADVASFRFAQPPVRSFAASEHALGRALLPDRADGRRRPADPAAVRAALFLCRRDRRRVDDALRPVRRDDRDDLGADHQGGAAARLRHLHGAGRARPVRLLARGPVRARRPGEDRSRRRHRPRRAEAARARPIDHGPGNFIRDPISAISFGMALMFGTAGLPHILMRFFTVPNARQARISVLWATGWIGYFYILTFIIGFGAIVLVATDPGFLDPPAACAAAATWRRSISPTRSAAISSSASSRRSRSRPSSRSSPA
jgi:cation/acetate symporter